MMTPRKKPTLKIRPEALRRKRLEAFLSVGELAHDVRLSESRIRQFEAGIDTATLTGTAKAIAARLNCSPEDITEIVDQVSQSEATA